MPEWTAFVAVTGLVLLLVLSLARATSTAVTTDEQASDRHAVADGDAAARAPAPDATRAARDPEESGTGPEPARSGTRSGPDEVGPEPTPDDDPESAHRNEIGRPRAEHERSDRRAVEDDRADETEARREAAATAATDRDDPREADAPDDLGGISTGVLLANVLITHGGFATVIAGAAVLTSIPAAALGIASAPLSTGLPAVGYGVGLGVALYLANVAMAANLGRVGIEHSEALRTSLSPDSVSGWALLFGVVLPLVAGFEELLFRAALIGAVAAGFGVSPWLLVVASSAAFALGHGMQGLGGILVTGLLGAVLGVAFVLTNSLLLVVVAHYLTNALEFVVAEGLDVDLKSAFRVGG